MVTVSATKLRQNLFDYLDKVSHGETIIVQRNNQEVARMIPMQSPNWRDKMRTQPKLLVSAEELVEPLEDVWDDYM